MMRRKFRVGKTSYEFMVYACVKGDVISLNTNSESRKRENI